MHARGPLADGQRRKEREMRQPIKSRQCQACGSEIDDFRHKPLDPKKVGRITNRKFCPACREISAGQRGYRLSIYLALHPDRRKGGRPLNPAPWQRIKGLAEKGLGVTAIANELSGSGFIISASTIYRRLKNEPI